MTQLAFWNLYNGVVKPPMPQASVLPAFQPARPQSRNSNNEAPLDLGKSRKEEKNNLDLHPPKREARDDENEEAENESEESDSDSEGEAEFEIPVVKNSSQGKF